MNTYYNYSLLIQYDGAGFVGWQRQKREKTVQGVILKELEKLCGHRINLIGAGRTDSGAHAVGQVANFKTGKSLKPDIIKRALNRALCPNIYIKNAGKVSQDFHARYDARKKLYRYIILREPSPFLYNYSYPYYGELSLARMRKAAKYLKGRHNFLSFCDGKNREKQEHKNRDSPHFFRSYTSAVRSKNPVRTIDRITIAHHLPPIFTPYPGRSVGFPGKSPVVISVDVEGHSFLCHMVRIIVGTLVEVGRGSLHPHHVKKVLEAKDRTLAGKTLPAKGLFLMKVYY